MYRSCDRGRLYFDSRVCSVNASARIDIYSTCEQKQHPYDYVNDLIYARHEYK